MVMIERKIKDGKRTFERKFEKELEVSQRGEVVNCLICLASLQANTVSELRESGINRPFR